jgi:NAD(P)-dependent dehydrogenase (short-subunit alcohol dehydrogenase family)
VHHLTRHLAGKMGRENILVNAIAPGSFPSKMMAATLKERGDAIISAVPIGRVGSPEDIAGTCIYLSSRAGQYTAGAVIVVDGGALVSSSRM